MNQLYESVRDIKAATAKRNKELARRVRRGDKEARAQMLLENLPMIWREVRRWIKDAPSALTTEDLASDAILCLLGHIDRYDPRGGTFSTYALAGLRSNAYRQMDRYRNIETVGYREAHDARAYDGLCDAARATGISHPTPEDISQIFNLDLPTVKRWAFISAKAPTGSLSGRGDRWPHEPVDPIKTDEKAEENMAAELAREKIDSLKGRQRKVIHGRFIEGRSLQSLAKEMNLERIDIRKIERAALVALRKDTPTAA